MARNLLERGFEVRALTRDPEKPEAKELTERGAEVVRGDLEDRSSLDRALEGVYGKRRSNTGFVVRHAITLTGLSANPRYHYRVESEDEASNPAASADLTFKTAR